MQVASFEAETNLLQYLGVFWTSPHVKCDERKKIQGISQNLSNTHRLDLRGGNCNYPKCITDHSLSSSEIHLKWKELKNHQKKLFQHFPSHENRDPFLSPSSVSSPLVVLATSVHICQLLKAIAPFIQVVIVLVSVWLWGVQGAQTSSFGTTSFIIKHKQRVVRRSRGVTISRLQVLKKKEDNRIFQWKESHTPVTLGKMPSLGASSKVDRMTTQPSYRTLGAINTKEVNLYKLPGKRHMIRC